MEGENAWPRAFRDTFLHASVVRILEVGRADDTHRIQEPFFELQSIVSKDHTYVDTNLSTYKQQLDEEMVAPNLPLSTSVCTAKPLILIGVSVCGQVDDPAQP